MRLSDEDIAEFQRLYKERYGIDISKEDAREQGMRLVQLTKMVCEHIARKKEEENESGEP